MTHFCPNMPLGLIDTGKKENLLEHKKWACTSNFCATNLQEFRLKWWHKELFLHCGDELNGLGLSWMGLTHGECHIYLTSLNPQLFKYIAYVGSFRHLSVQLFLHVFCNSTKTRAVQSGWGLLFPNFYKSPFYGIFDHQFRLKVNFFTLKVPNLWNFIWWVGPFNTPSNFPVEFRL